MVYQRKPCQNANSFTYNNKDIQIHELARSLHPNNNKEVKMLQVYIENYNLQ